MYSGIDIMKNHHEIAESGVQALQAFAAEFGSDDAFTRLVMEVIFEELFNVENYKSEQES